MSNNSKMPSKKQGPRPWLLQGVIIAVIPVLGYLCAYVQEFAFCSIFTIPTEFIIVSWTNILINAGSILVILYLLFWGWPILYLYYIGEKGWRRLGPIRQRLIFPIISSFIVIVLIIAFPSIRPLISIGFSIPLMFLYLIFIVPLVTQSKVKGYRNKLKAEHDYEHKGKPHVLARYFGTRQTIFILLLILIPTIFYLNGIDNAQSQKEFLIPSTNQQLVVLRIYGSNLICAPFDREKREIERAFYILEMRDITLTPEEVGPLTVSSKVSE